jgi:hypothetical protein
VRVLVAFVVAVLTSSSTLAWALPCCAHEEDATAGDSAGAPAESNDGCCAGGHALSQETNDPDRPDEPCSCPLGCAPCCAGAPAPAIVPLPVAAQAYFEAWTLLELTYPDREPPDGADRDVLHVPRRPAPRI